MSEASLVSKLAQDLSRPTGGVAAFVDALLKAALNVSLQVQWKDGRVLLRHLDAALSEDAVLSIPKSALRAALARVAVLCSQVRADSVSPYEGTGTIFTDGNPQGIDIRFENTADRVRLELSPKREPAPLVEDAMSAPLPAIQAPSRR